MIGSYETRLGPSRGRKFTHSLGGLFLLLIGLLFIVGGVGMSISIIGDETVTPWFHGFAFMMAALGTLIGYIAVGIFRDYVFRNATLTIDSESLTIDDPRGLDRPVTVPLAQVKAFAVSEGSAVLALPLIPLRRAATWHGAHDINALGADHGFFIEPGAARAAVLPVGAASVNLLLVFHAPVQFEVDTKIDSERKRMKVTAQVGAVVLPSRDVELAAEVLRQRGVRDFVDESDAMLAIPPYRTSEGSAGVKDSVLMEMGWFYPQLMPVAMPTPMPEPQAEQPAGPVVSNELGYAPGQIKRAMKRAALAFYARLLAGVSLIFFAAYVFYDRVGIYWPIGFLAVIGVLVLLTIWPRSSDVEYDGLAEIDLRRSPMLSRHLQNVANRLQAAEPHHAFATLELGSSATITQERPRLPSSYELYLGLNNFAAVDEREIDGMLAHEVAHSLNFPGQRSVFGKAAESSAQMAGWSDFAIVGQVADSVNKHFQKRAYELIRECEYSADLLAAQAVGPNVVATMLKRLVVSDAALEIYWANFVVPALELGMHPPLADGFTSYVRHSAITAEMRKDIDEIIAADAAESEYDTHPSVARRIAQLEKHFPGAVRKGLPELSRPSTVLIGDLQLVEHTLLRSIGGEERAAALRPVVWPDALRTTLPLLWHRRAGIHIATVGPHTIEQAASMAANQQWFAEVLGVPPGLSPAPHLRSDPHAPLFPQDWHLAWVLESLLGLSFLAAGYELQVGQPGEPVLLARGESQVDINELVGAMMEREIAPEEWEAMCAARNLTSLRYADAFERGAANSNGIISNDIAPPISASVA